MLYIGYPVSLETAFMMFGDKNPQAYDQPRLNNFRAHLAKYGLKLEFYDKNIYILGMVVEEIHVSNDNYVSVDDTLALILSYKKRVSEGLAAAGANLSEFDIEIMEDEPLRVYNPQPYVIT